MQITGLMSGTSADGIDAALVEIAGSGRDTRVQLRQFLCLPHSAEMRGAILDACNAETARVPNLCALNAALGEKFAEAAIAVAEAAGITLADVDAIASHGQTIWHQPEPRAIGGLAVTGTLQLGEPSVIAARTGCRVVSNFRAADMAAGGQGAPLVPYFDWALLTSDTESRAALNIGGIANVTYLPKGAALNDVIAFDTGPGNILIDELIGRFTDGKRQYDHSGEMASSGQHSLMMTEFLLSDAYFERSPPKSTGRELFSIGFIDRFMGFWQRAADRETVPISDLYPDILATATMATAASIRMALELWLNPRGGVETVIVGGGGVHNKTLMRTLTDLLAPARIATLEDFGIPGDAKEAMAFAVLAYETIHGRPSNVPSATGASRPAILGSITPAP